LIQEAQTTKKNTMTKKKTLLTAALVIVVVAIAGTIYAYKEYNRKGVDIADAKAIYSNTTIELIEAFTNNEKASNAKYLSKVIEITGDVKKIDTDEKGFPTIVLGEASSMSSVRCSLDSLYTNSAANILVGQKISVKGICTGFIADELGIGSDVILTHCIAQKK